MLSDIKILEIRVAKGEPLCLCAAADGTSTVHATVELDYEARDQDNIKEIARSHSRRLHNALLYGAVKASIFRKQGRPSLRL